MEKLEGGSSLLLEAATMMFSSISGDEPPFKVEK
jgi:hypothetical protein